MSVWTAVAIYVAVGVIQTTLLTWAARNRPTTGLSWREMEARLDPNPTLARQLGRWLMHDGVPWLVISLIWPVVLVMLLIGHLRKPDAAQDDRERDAYPAFELGPDHLVEPLTVEQIERRELVDDPLHAVPPVPFGFLHESWQALRAQLQPGDELWSFDARRTVTWYGVNYAERRTGYAIVRNGQPVASMLTMDRREKAPPPP